MNDKTSQITSHPAVSYPLKGWLFWGLGTLFYCYEFFIQVSPNVMAPNLMQTFQASATSLGHLGAFYFYAYALMQIPVGLLIDRFGVRKWLSIAALLCSLGCYWFAQAHSLHVAAIGRFLMGLGSSFAVVSCLHLAATWLPKHRFALLTGIMLSIGMLGAVAGEAPLALLIAHLGWRSVMQILSLAGLVLAILIALIIRDRPMVIALDSEEPSPPNSFYDSLLPVIKQSRSWIVAIYAGLIFSTTPALGGLWGVSFYMKSHSLSRPSAAYIISMMFIGWILGGPFFGWLSDRLKRRVISLRISSVGTLLSLLMALYLPPLSLWLIGLILFGVGFFSSAFLPAFSLIREINPPQSSATALGFMNGLNSVGAALSQPLIGWLLDVSWTSKGIADKMPFYSVADYHLALAVLPIFALISLFLLPWIRETYCEYVTEPTKQLDAP